MLQYLERLGKLNLNTPNLMSHKKAKMGHCFNFLIIRYVEINPL